MSDQFHTDQSRRPDMLREADCLDRAAAILRSAYVRGKLTEREVMTLQATSAGFGRAARHWTADMVAEAKPKAEQ